MYHHLGLPSPHTLSCPHIHLFVIPYLMRAVLCHKNINQV